jgi:NFACT N-terminal and middle domains/NFACT protein RNA binding domain
VGRHLTRPRLAGPSAVGFEISGSRDRWLWLDAGRTTAGLYLLSRETARRLVETAPADAPGRARQALLHFRKHVGGARVSAVERVAGERALVLTAGDATLVLRVGGAPPALTLARAGGALASLGDGREAWPVPAASPEREWDRLDPRDFEAAVASALAEGRSLVRAVVLACPGLGPVLARELDGSAGSLVALQARLATPVPTVVGPGPPESWHDAELFGRDAVLVAPIALGQRERTDIRADSWLAAGALFLEARWRGLAFERRRRSALDETRRALRRLGQLEVNLEGDLAGLADERRLRREAEALVSFGHRLRPGASSAELPDPHDPALAIVVSLDPRLSGFANAERLFAKARRAERARHQIDLRLRETRAAASSARQREALLVSALDLRDLDEHAAEAATAGGRELRAGPSHYLTSRGLSVLVGRSARENHHLTFRVARGEDLWLHARDLPGAHVILRDNEGRAGADDLREAAELAAFFSDGRQARLVDVHVTRRKHVRPARGGPGRVFVSHSDTLRVAPRDPEGRLRKR